jgi:hypothetical protein
MSIAEHYETANFYDNLNEEEINNRDKMVRTLFVTSYLGNESEFLDSLKSRICQDLSNYELEKHYTRVYKRPLFIGRSSQENNMAAMISEYSFLSTTWVASDPNKLIIFKDYSKEIDINCN